MFAYSITLIKKKGHEKWKLCGVRAQSHANRYIVPLTHSDCMDCTPFSKSSHEKKKNQLPNSNQWIYDVKYSKFLLCVLVSLVQCLKRQLDIISLNNWIWVGLYYQNDNSHSIDYSTNSHKHNDKGYFNFSTFVSIKMQSKLLIYRKIGIKTHKLGQTSNYIQTKRKKPKSIQNPLH